MSDVENDATRLAKIALKGKIAISSSAAETANAGQVIQLSQFQIQPMTDFYSELRYAVISGVSPQLRKPIQIQADELFLSIYPRVMLSNADKDDIAQEEFELEADIR